MIPSRSIHIQTALLLALAAGCGTQSGNLDAPATQTSASSAPIPSASVAAIPASAATAVTSAAPVEPAYPGRTDGCPAGMVRVEGEYCPAVMQDCLEHHQEYKDHADQKNVSERCLRYAEPSRCVLNKRKHLSFCMDRFEYPNKVGELPRVLISWTHAVATCKAEGKRLCTEDEFNFACEGPDILPYVYGYVRDPKKCSIDKEYRYPDHSKVLPEYDECLTLPWCKTELARLDQRLPIGASLTCVSWAGIYDLNGNANEWVEIPGQKPPNRSGLKGGWWGPVRGRCRPTVTFHKESDYGYEQGFRCCADAASGK
ncbi:MAG: SUMF1/EgtB/PvdO family nonheme iron enzyme [Minicystis sp.]